MGVKRWRKRNKIFQYRVWAVSWRIREVKTAMIQSLRQGTSCFCVCLPTKHPPDNEQKTQPSVFTHNSLELLREREEERNNLNGLPKAVWLTFQQHYTEATGSTCELPRVQTHILATNQQAKWIFCTTTMFIAKYITLRFCWVKKKPQPLLIP